MLDDNGISDPESYQAKGEGDVETYLPKLLRKYARLRDGIGEGSWMEDINL